MSAYVSAEASWLDFCDDQYGRDDSPEAIAASIESRLGTARTVLVPLGLFHADHILTYRASAMLVAVDMRRCWIGYEDALYRSFSTLLCERVASLRAGGCLGERIARCENVDAMRMKRRAMACYRSQLRALSRVGVGHMDALAPEGYWRLHSVTG